MNEFFIDVLTLKCRESTGESFGLVRHFDGHDFVLTDRKTDISAHVHGLLKALTINLIRCQIRRYRPERGHEFDPLFGQDFYHLGQAFWLVFNENRDC
jgi:hypothetical protein